MDALDFAFEILQGMLLKSESFYPVEGDSSRYVGLGTKANEMLGGLWPEAMGRYRVMYDASAKVIYEQAASGDFGKLHQVVDRYRYTSYGPKAMNLLGSVYFDRGRFAQAAAMWQLLLSTHPPDEEAPLLQTKAAIAYHLAGQTEMADKMAKAPKDKYPSATAEVSGQRRKLLDFIAEARQIQPDTIGSLPEFLRPKHTWPGPGGVSDGAAIMSDCDTMLVSRWLATASEAGISSPMKVPGDLLALQEVFNNPQANMNGQNISLKMASGLVQVQLNGNMYGRVTSGLANLAPAIHPLIVDNLVIYRTSYGITARDILTGEVVWEKGTKLSPFPMQRALNINLPYWGGQQQGAIEDVGRYMMTLGGGRLYAVGNYRPWLPPQWQMMLGGPGGAAQKKDVGIDSSTLAAISLKAQGKLCWQVGNGAGDDDLVRFGKILGALTYYMGKLYTVSSYMDSYHVVCLDSDTGKLLWKNAISQNPNAGGNMWNGWQQGPAERAGPLAVADGRVFALTNAGVIAAFDCESGQPLWAYQYDAPSGTPGQPYYGPRMVSVGDRPVNPVLAVGGRVIALPTDLDKVLCLSADEGKPLWTSAERHGQHDLSYIDDHRFLMSGPGMYVLSADDGKEVYGVSVRGIIGRPVVTAHAVLASGQGKLHRLDLDKYILSTIDLISPEAMLGNLVCVDGVLVAANAAGVCAYFNYDQALARMSERIGQAPAADKLRLTFQRGQISFTAKRIPAALTDFLDCQKMAREQGDDQMTLDLAPWLRRAYVAMANHATDPRRCWTTSTRPGSTT